MPVSALFSESVLLLIACFSPPLDTIHSRYGQCLGEGRIIIRVKVTVVPGKLRLIWDTIRYPAFSLFFSKYFASAVVRASHLPAYLTTLLWKILDIGNYRHFARLGRLFSSTKSVDRPTIASPALSCLAFPRHDPRVCHGMSLYYAIATIFSAYQ